MSDAYLPGDTRQRIQDLTFSRSLLLGQAKLHPEDAEAAGLRIKV